MLSKEDVMIYTVYMDVNTKLTLMSKKVRFFKSVKTNHGWFFLLASKKLLESFS